MPYMVNLDNFVDADYLILLIHVSILIVGLYNMATSKFYFL